MTFWRIIMSCPLQQLLKTRELSGCCGIMMGNTSWAFCCDSSFDPLQSDSGLSQWGVQWAEQAGFVSWLHLLLTCSLRGRSWGCGTEHQLPPALRHCGSTEPPWLMLPPLHGEVGWEWTRDLKAQPVGPYRGAKGWYRGDWNSVKCLNSLSKARIV